jgi:hypothetical protein
MFAENVSIDCRKCILLKIEGGNLINEKSIRKNIFQIFLLLINNNNNGQ